MRLLELVLGAAAGGALVVVGSHLVAQPRSSSAATQRKDAELAGRIATLEGQAKRTQAPPPVIIQPSPSLLPTEQPRNTSGTGTESDRPVGFHSDAELA